MDNDEKIFDNDNNLDEKTASAHQDDELATEPKKKSTLRSIGEWIFAFAFALIVTFSIKGFVMDFVVVDGSSMEPTLSTHDRLILTKLGYQPKAGDIIVFDKNYSKREAQIDKRKSLYGGSIGWFEEFKYRYFPSRGLEIEPVYYVKRVIAMPGDVIDINSTTGKVQVNGNILHEPYINGGADAPTPKIGNLAYPYTVEPGYIFVMGDNRSHSEDSRMIGAVPISAVLGKAALRIWPLKSFSIIYH